MSKTNQKGFTLVEIAIVLVIIGLLLGGVMKGQALIANAKTKALILQMDGYTTAYNIYMDTYGAMPGDDANALANLPGKGINGNPVVNGSGNGYFSGTEGDKLVFDDLFAAGLISGYTAAANGRPLNKDGGQMFYRSNYAGLSGSILCSYVSNEQAREMDRKLDDGKGNSGSYRRNNNAPYAAVGTAGKTYICTAS